MLNFGEILRFSAGWTITVLFRPFKFRKWLILAFIAIMAGCMSSGCNFNFNNISRYMGKDKEARASQPSISLEEPGEPSRASDNKPFTSGEKRAFIIVMSVVVLIILAFAVLFMWVSSRFSFIFLEDVIKNDASIAAPFNANREIGNSYFLFNLALSGVSLVLFGGIIYTCVMHLIKAGAFNNEIPGIKQVLGFLIIILPHLLLMSALFFSFGLISLIMTNFVVVAMFKDRTRILEAWGKVLVLLKKNILNFIVYILIKAGLYICAGIVYFTASLFFLLAALIPVALSGALFYLISRLIMAPYLTAYWIMIGIISAPFVMVLLYCLMCLYLPFAVFFRTFGVKFLGRLDPKYDLIVS